MAGNKLGSNRKSDPLATGTGNSREGSYVEVVVEVLTVSIFFDGTRNNRFNTEAGLKSEQQRKRDISYQNYYSNVASPPFRRPFQQVAR